MIPNIYKEKAQFCYLYTKLVVPTFSSFLSSSYCGSVAKSCLTLQPQGLQHTRLPCLSLSPRVCSNSCPLSRWCIQPPHSLSLPSPPALNLSQHQGLFQCSLHQVTKVSELPITFQVIGGKREQGTRYKKLK